MLAAAGEGNVLHHPGDEHERMNPDHMSGQTQKQMAGKGHGVVCILEGEAAQPTGWLLRHNQVRPHKEK